MTVESSLKSYDHVAGFYDVLSDVYSMGQIKAAKLDQLRYMNPGERVLFVGCGGGHDVVAAAKHGCDVTAVDTSPKMLAKLQGRLDQCSVKASLICDRFEKVTAEPFDAVCCNFFLNCFTDDLMQQMLQQITSRVRPGGTLMIADVSPPAGNVFSRVTNTIYLQGAMLPFWAMGLVQWHPNHDYVTSLERLGWKAEEVNTFRMLKLGPVVFRNIVATCR